MFFVIITADKPGALSLRMQTKAAHSRFLDSAPPEVKVLQSGPWLDGEGREAGSIMVVQADSQADVEAFLSNEPYTAAGLFASVVIRPWNWRRGNPYLA